MAIVCLILVFAGAAIQVAIGAGLSVVCGSVVLVWIGGAQGVPLLLALNLIVSVAATAVDARAVSWSDVVLASAATLGGCALASLIPGLSDRALRALTAGVLLLAALPRSPAAGKEASAPGEMAARGSIAVGSLVSGALTVWTATPGPVTPIAFTRAGRSGADIRRAMQPISVVGYGAALVFLGLPRPAAIGLPLFALLVAATLAGTAIGFPLRARIDARRVVLLIRVTAAAAAALLIVSLLR